MKMIGAILVAVLALIFPVAAMPWGFDIEQEQKNKKNVTDEVRAKLDKVCEIPVTQDTKRYWELRYIRAQFILSAITRYGAARIEDYYGGEADIRSAYLLVKVNNSVAAIRDAMNNNNADTALHNVELADVTDALLRAAAAAMKATTDKLKGFALAPNWGDGKEFLANALEDALYEQAYKADCASLMNEGKDEKNIAQIQATVNGHLVKQCDRVSKMNGLPHNCRDLAAR